MTTVARVMEISAISEVSFDDAIRAGISRAHETVRGLQSAWVKEQEVQIGADGRPSGFKVNMLITFVLDGQVVNELSPYPDPATQTADFAVFQDPSA